MDWRLGTSVSWHLDPKSWPLALRAICGLSAFLLSDYNALDQAIQHLASIRPKAMPVLARRQHAGLKAPARAAWVGILALSKAAPSSPVCAGQPQQFTVVARSTSSRRSCSISIGVTVLRLSSHRRLLPMALLLPAFLPAPMGELQLLTRPPPCLGRVWWVVAAFALLMNALSMAFNSIFVTTMRQIGEEGLLESGRWIGMIGNQEARPEGRDLKWDSMDEVCEERPAWTRL